MRGERGGEGTEELDGMFKLKWIAFPCSAFLHFPLSLSTQCMTVYILAWSAKHWQYDYDECIWDLKFYFIYRRWGLRMSSFKASSLSFELEFRLWRRHRVQSPRRWQRNIISHPHCRRPPASPFKFNFPFFSSLSLSSEDSWKIGNAFLDSLILHCIHYIPENDDFSHVKFPPHFPPSPSASRALMRISCSTSRQSRATWDLKFGGEKCNAESHQKHIKIQEEEEVEGERHELNIFTFFMQSLVQHTV